MKEMKDNNLAGLEGLKKRVELLKLMVVDITSSINSIDEALGTMVGDPLKLTYGYSKGYGNCEGSRTEIKMSRDCTVGELRWTLTHVYGVDDLLIRVKGSSIRGGIGDKVKEIYMDDTWGRKEYTIVTEER